MVSVLVAMLINPEDGKPTNYVVEPHPTNLKKHRIVGIDNDHAFVPAIVTEKPKKELFSQKLIPIAQVKTVLYCLDQMKSQVHPTIRNLFINLRPDEILDEWLRELKKVNASYSDLFPSSQDHVKFFKEHECFLGIPFQKGAISHLYDKFVTLRDLLTKNPHLSHLDLLAKLEERLAKRYRAASHLASVKERWDGVDAVFYEKTKIGSGTTLTRSGDILRSMSIPLEESVFESIRLGKALGPIQALEELSKQKEVIQNKTLESLGARAGDFNILKTLQLESTRAMFLEKLDFKGLSPQQQEAVLSYLKTKQLQALTLKNCSLLNDTLLQILDLSQLIKLDLRGCEGTTYRSLVHLSNIAPNLEELNLSTIKSLIEMGDIGAIYDDPLLFNKLHILNLSHCINLTKLLIKAPKLHYLNLENCRLLNDQMLDGVIAETKKLTKLCLNGADKISAKNLREKCPTFPLTDTNRRFLNGKLVYKPNPGSDVGRIELPIAALQNPLEGTFDLSLCGDSGQYLCISTGYRKEKKEKNADKLEIWFVLRSEIEKDIATTACHFKEIMGSWNEKAPVGIFWTWGGGAAHIFSDYLVTENMDELSNDNLYKKWCERLGRHSTHHISRIPLSAPPTDIAGFHVYFELK